MVQADLEFNNNYLGCVLSAGITDVYYCACLENFKTLIKDWIKPDFTFNMKKFLPNHFQTFKLLLNDGTDNLPGRMVTQKLAKYFYQDDMKDLLMLGMIPE